MNGAHALLATLSANGVDTVFANPGTSEMHFVAALDDAPGVRGVLCLFEGVATGAADGFARVTGRPAATLLHLGPGLGNGWANLHNARRGRVPLVNVVGDHATYHAQYDAPLQSDISALAGALEGWYRRSPTADDVATDAAEAVAAAYGPPGRVATLALPADSSWNELSAIPSAWPTAPRAAAPAVAESAWHEAVEALRDRPTTLVLGGTLRRRDLALANALAERTGARAYLETFTTSVERGAGWDLPRVSYLSEFALDQLKGSEAIVLLGGRSPVGFFAYPHVASRLAPDDARVIDLVPPGGDVAGALEALAAELSVDVPAAPATAPSPEPRGALDARSMAAAVGATLVEGMVVVDETVTSGVHLAEATLGSPAHRWLSNTGGAIGFGLPCAVGAAVGTGGRVLALEADGSMMYTPQALWTMARESLDVTVVALANRQYAILNWELARVGATADGSASRRLLSLDDPALSLVQVAAGQGVPGEIVERAEDLAAALRRSYATPGPYFIEARLA